MQVEVVRNAKRMVHLANDVTGAGGHRPRMKAIPSLTEIDELNKNDSARTNGLDDRRTDAS